MGTWGRGQLIGIDVEEFGPDLAADLVSKQPSLADRHPPQGGYIGGVLAQGFLDVGELTAPPEITA